MVQISNIPGGLSDYSPKKLKEIYDRAGVFYSTVSSTKEGLRNVDFDKT